MTRPARVYIVQRPARRDRATGEWIDKYDMTAAEKHGRLVQLLQHTNVARDMDQALARLEHRLSDWLPGDHLLAAGDPVAIALAVLVASRYCGRHLSLLKWDRIDQQYYAYRVPVVK